MAIGPLLSYQLVWLQPAVLTRFFIHCAFVKNSLVNRSSTELVNNSYKENPKSELLLALTCRSLKPRLINLSEFYEQIFVVYGETGQMVTKAQCVHCRQCPKTPAICLLCGELLCFNSKCCATKISESATRVRAEVSQITSYQTINTCLL